LTSKPAKGGRYLYYSCTSVNRFGKKNCQIKQVPAQALESAVLCGLKEVSQNDYILQKMVEKANQISKEEVIPLEEELELKKIELETTKRTTKTFLESLKDGRKTLGIIEEELENLENHKEDLEREINLL